MAAGQVSVTLSRWLWIYFLGWLEAMRKPAETEQIIRILNAISKAVASND